MSRVPSVAESCFTVAALLLLSGGFVHLLLPRDGTSDPGVASKVLFSAVYLGTLILIVRRWREILRLFLVERYLALLHLLAFASLLWSHDSSVTALRGVALSGTTLFGAYLAVRYREGELLGLLAWTVSLAMLASLVFVLAFPDLGLMTDPFHVGSWRGIYSHKNSLGMVMALGVCVYGLLAGEGVDRRHGWGGLFLSASLLVLSTSKSSAAAAAVVLIALGAYWARKRSYPAAVVASLAAAVLCGSLLSQILFSFHAPTAASALVARLSAPAKLSAPDVAPSSPETVRPPGPVPKPPAVSIKNLKTLTGRTELWRTVWDMIKNRPWLGYGFGAFWLERGPSARVWRVLTWKPPTAHNGPLDIWLELGLVGLLLMLASMARITIKTIHGLRDASRRSALFPAVFLLCLTLLNLTESVLLRQNSIFWALYVAVTLSWHHRRSQRQPSCSPSAEAGLENRLS